MTQNTVIDFARPSDFSPDPLTDLLRVGAQELLTAAILAEVSEFMGGHAHLLDDEGRQRLARHGFLPEREVMTEIGKVPVQVPRVRDRGTNADTFADLNDSFAYGHDNPFFELSGSASFLLLPDIKEAN